METVMAADSAAPGRGDGRGNPARERGDTVVVRAGSGQRLGAHRGGEERAGGASPAGQKSGGRLGGGRGQGVK